MFTVSSSVEIQCPPRAVFALAGDYANDPLWRSGVLSMVYDAGAPPGVGTRTRETLRSMGRTAVTVGEITDYSPSRTAFRSVSGPVPCDGSRAFAASAAGTLFTYTLRLHPAGPLRAIEPLLRWAFGRRVRADLHRLKRLLETPGDCQPRVERPGQATVR